METAIYLFFIFAAFSVGGALVFFLGLKRTEAKIATLKEETQNLHAAITGYKESIAALTAQKEAAGADIARREERIENLNQDLQEKHAATTRDKERIATLTAQKEANEIAAKEKIELLRNMQGEMEKKFKLLAQEALEKQGDAFAKANTEKLTATLTPLREQVSHFEKELKGANESAIKERASLTTMIGELGKKSQTLSEETNALSRALKVDSQKQGAWGEMILENILRNSGLREGSEYETQKTVKTAEGKNVRPDVIISLPGDKKLVIDSKVALKDYMDMSSNETSAPARAASGLRHAGALKRHIDTLSAKDYQHASGINADYVIMFLPVESALPEALKIDSTLTEYALKKHITIATPTTLMMALKTIAQVWAVERRNVNAEKIANQAGQLYDKFAGFIGNMEKIGTHLDRAKDSHVKAFDQLSRGRGNILSKVDQLKTLGANTQKVLSVEFEEPSDTANSPVKRLK